MAQPVARLVRNEKVRGSSPLSSTTSNMPLTRAFVLMAASWIPQYFSHVPPVLPSIRFSAQARSV